MNGTFQDFLDALRAFESGWDRNRYEAGVIADWQLDQWAGGSVSELFPQYSSWSQLSEAEWEAMSYRSTNSLGFVGYQFGEALLIDLGYYRADQFYGNGASRNNWLGEWTGRNGVDSLEEFMTADAQEPAIREAFGYNLGVITRGLEQSGGSLDALIGTNATYLENGVPRTVELTLTGILAAAHLRGAWGTLSLLQNGAVSQDEYGTSILRYIDQFGGYAAPTPEALIAFHENGPTNAALPGDDGTTAPPADDPAPVDPAPMDPPADDPSPNEGPADGPGPSSGDVFIDWSWGSNVEVSGFSVSDDVVRIAWIGAANLSVYENASGDVVFAVPSNQQTTTLKGVSLSDLGPANIDAKDAGASFLILGLIGGSAPVDPPAEDPEPEPVEPPAEAPPPVMYMVAPTSPSRVIENFRPGVDMLHIEGGVTGERFDIFEESGDAIGLSVRVVLTDEAGGILSTTILVDVALSDLSLGDFMIADQGVLNEVASAIGASIVEPSEGSGGFDIVYDSDGSNPPTTTGATAAGGVKWRADPNADDIVGFDPARDELDFGSVSVHGLIITKTPAGEVAIDSPWSDAVQVVRGVSYDDLTIESFGVVGNEHLRQDIGGVVSWELGIGPRDPDTVYVRSHQYGVAETVQGFDPGSMTLSFVYFGTRERLSVTDTADGLVISSLPSGQSLTLAGVRLADLSPGRVEFHHDQVMEDNLETAFGFDQNDVALVDRTVLLTPAAPPGQSTDGFQVRNGANQPPTDGSGGGQPDPAPVDPGPVEPAPSDPVPTDPPVASDGGEVTLTWNWGVVETYSDFDPDADVIDFGNLGADQIEISEQGAVLVIEVLGNGGHAYRFQDVSAEALSRSNLDAPSWSQVLDASGGVVDQLTALGFDPLA